MSLVGTLGKVALGIVVAKGVGKMMSGGAGGAGAGGLGGLLGGQGGAGGLGSLLGGQQQGGAQQGQAGGQGGGQAGGLGGLLGGAGGGAAGGLGGLLGGAQPQGGGAGGLGGLLDSLGGAGGAAAGGAAGGLGGLLNSALNGQQLQEQPTQQQEETAKILIQAMVNAAKSDGQIDEQEQQKIVANLGEEVSEEERQFVLSEMQSPLDVDGFIRNIPRGAEQQVYLMSLMAIDLDSQAEAQYLDKLREGIGMSQEACNAIHQQVGVPTLYG